MEIKTCEEYVLNELNNEISKNERLAKEVEELKEENKKSKEQNDKLMDLIKVFIEKGEFKNLEEGAIFYSLFLHSFVDEEVEAIKELIKIKEQLENE